MDALSIHDLHKVYNNGLQALKGIDLTVKQGEFYALLGANGAGKSTIIGVISSLVTKTRGKVSIFGLDIDEQRAQSKCCLGLVPQEFNFNMWEPIGEILINQAGYYGIARRVAKQRADKYLKQLGLWDKRYEMARNLSGGMKRRLMIARALVHEPRLLILDEPTAGVDIEIRRSMWQFLTELNQQGVTIILTTHYLEEAEQLCEKVAIIDEGKIIEDMPIKTLLSQLNTETIVLNLQQSLQQSFELPNYPYRCVDDHTLEIDIHCDQSLNDLFLELDQASIQVLSMRNKHNRLETLFIDLVEKKNHV